MMKPVGVSRTVFVLAFAVGIACQNTSAANFKFDLNVNGAINSSDISLVKARSGTVLVP